ncbi:MAG TPA: hypothetical protein VEK15_27705 [Vicinamibacteria bacterium]|nr:hypothetical protein [Vicinamibacteria bacterium]
MSAYTPGPWRVGFEDGTGGVDDDGGAWIIGADEEIVVAGGSHDGLKYGVTDEANARLISVAPDLLAAAQRALAFFELLRDKSPGRGGEAGLEPEALLLKDVIRRAEGDR